MTCHRSWRPSERALLRDFRAKLAQWRILMMQETIVAHQMLDAVLREKVLSVPRVEGESCGYEISAKLEGRAVW